MQRGRRTVTSYVCHVSARTRSLITRRHPGGGRAVAKVYAVNAEGRLGGRASHAFPTKPTVRTLREAARLSARSAVRGGDGVVLRTHCPKGRPLPRPRPAAT
jgi:hypothetical protein